MTNFRLKFTKHFIRKYRKLVKNNKTLQSRFSKTFKLLQTNPNYSGLKTHIVEIPLGKVNSSYVSGDLRILWRYGSNMITFIEVIDVGGHEGKNKVYK